MHQTTTERTVRCRGIGLHGGREVELTARPAAAGTGVVFACRDGLGGQVEIPACVASVQSASRATTLAAPTPRSPAEPGDGASAGEPVRVATVEHLLAAVYALGIDNLRIEVDGAEVPMFDGSASPFVAWLEAAGLRPLDRPRPALRVVEPLEVRDGDRWIRVAPADALHISYAIDFAHPSIGRQTLEIPSLDRGAFERELAAARTFGFAHEVEALHDAGLALGGSMDNTIVLDEAGVLNEEGLRWADEFVRHKVVDLVGDLALLGARLDAHIRVEKGGHRLHHGLVRALVETPGVLCWSHPPAGVESAPAFGEAAAQAHGRS